MTTYEVYEQGGDFFVKGLKSERRDGDQRLLYHIPYPESETPEVTDPKSADNMHAALYDMYQWHDGLKEGDKFTTPYGNFKCVSFHVVKDIPGRREWASFEGSATRVVFNPTLPDLLVHTNLGWTNVTAELEEGQTLEQAAERLAASYKLTEVFEK